MPLIRVSHASRLDPAAKEALHARLTAAYAEATGGDPAKVWVMIEELDRADWATGGASLAARDAAAARG